MEQRTLADIMTQMRTGRPKNLPPDGGKHTLSLPRTDPYGPAELLPAQTQNN